jgi:electron transport complex protein RnfB
MKKDVYRQLQQDLDSLPVPYPETLSGVEISLLKHLFTEEEARIALNVSALPEGVKKIHNRFKEGEISAEHLTSLLDNLAKKGAIMSVPNPRGGRRYSKMPLAIGMFEFQVDRITKEYAEDFYKYEDEGFADAFLKTETKQMRTIPVNVDINPEFLVGKYDDARALIEKSPGPFAVMNCVCRQGKEKMGHKCSQTDIRETCFTIGKSARLMMERGVARKLSKPEMLDLIGRAEKEGMVLQPANNQEPGFICCCCGCCCGVLTAAKKYDNPSEFLHANFLVEINPDKCTACGECIELCQMDALESVNNHTEVLEKRCIGCAVCVSACATDAISLIKKDKETIPPRNNQEMYKKMIKERFGLFGTLKILGKAALGKKI